MTVTERADIRGTYMVLSGPNTYHVDLRNEWEPSCDCPAGCWSDRVCRHVTAALAYKNGDLE